MQKIFLVFGYGIPKDITKNENYGLYLKQVFNRIFDLNQVARSTGAISKTGKLKTAGKPLVIFCGGKTDMYKPYQRSEADEMVRFLKTQIKLKPFLKNIIQSWKIITEKNSLSTLENLLNSKKILQKLKIRAAEIFIFCEQSRQGRIKKVAAKIFNTKNKIKIIPIDFDTSANRYIDQSFLVKKEQMELKHMLWALKSPANLKKHHQVFAEKISFLRKAGPKAHGPAIIRWWQKKMEEMSS